MPVLLVTCFTVSGATSLILQVVWARQLTEVFGSSSLAIATVLATFMAGLALGARLGGRLADRMRPGGRGLARLGDPLLGYAVAEAIVGVAALLIPLLIVAYRAIGPALWLALGDSPVLLGLVRFGLTAGVLLVPTTAMGATLPLMGRHVTRGRDDLPVVSRRLGALYAANTAGALLGAGSAGFWLIPAIGVAASSRVAAVGALALAAAVAATVLLGRRGALSPALSGADLSDGAAAPAGDDGIEGADLLTGRPPPDPPRAHPLLLFTYAASGAVAMGLEVLFSRALGVVLGSSVYSFTLVLVVFLSGLSAGAALAAGPAARLRRPATALAALFVALALAAAFAHLLLDELPSVLVAMLEGSTLEIRTLLAIHLVVAGLVILPVALGLGAVLPLVMRCFVGDLDRVGRDVGRAYAANTIGGIAGSLAAGFVALPLLGLELSLRLCGALQAGLALLVLIYAARVHARRPSRPVLAAAAAAAVLAFLSPAWDRSDFTAGLFRGHILTDSIEHGRLLDREVAYYRDGVSTTVSVERTGESWVLKNNGKVEASDRHDMPTQILVGLLPTFLHGGTDQDVFLIGYGSGVTVGAITQDERVARIDVAELEPAVIEAADRYFAEVSHHPAKDPRVHRYIGDGRNVLLAQGRTYDVIVSEPSNPWIAGVATLFTSDFYRLAKGRLAKGGIFCQWAQLYELGPARVKMIYRTFHEVFPYVYAFTPGDETTDTILLGADHPIDLDLAALEARMAGSPRLAAELARAQVESPEELVASLFLGPDEVASFTAGAGRNTDDNARLEHTAPRDLLASVRGNHFARSVRGPTWPYGHLDGLVTGFGEGERRIRRQLALGRALLGYGRRREAAAWLERARAAGATGAEVDRLALLMDLSDTIDFADPELVVTAGGAPLPPPAPGLFRVRDPARARAASADLAEAYRLVADGSWPAAWKRMARLPPRTDDDAGRDVDLLAAYAAYKSVNEMVRARQILRPLYDDDALVERRPSVAYYMGRVSYGLGAFRDGLRALERFADLRPDLAREVVDQRLPPR